MRIGRFQKLRHKASTRLITLRKVSEFSLIQGSNEMNDGSSSGNETSLADLVAHSKSHI